MFSMTKSKELDEKQRQDADVNKRHYGEDVKSYHNNNTIANFRRTQCQPTYNTPDFLLVAMV